MDRLTGAIRKFYEEGQRHPEPLLEALREAVRKERIFRPLPEEGGWLVCAAAAAETEEAGAAPLGDWIRRARRERGCPGLLIGPGPEPVYLSRDLMDRVLPEAKEEPAARDPAALLARAEALLELEEEDAKAKALALCQEALQAAREAPDLYVYPAVCIRLAASFQDAYSREDLLSFTDTAITCCGTRVNAGEEEAADLLILAKRLKEQIQQGGNRKMKKVRNITGLFL